jgi:hypothetical protein
VFSYTCQLTPFSPSTTFHRSVVMQIHHDRFLHWRRGLQRGVDLVGERDFRGGRLGGWGNTMCGAGGGGVYTIDLIDSREEIGRYNSNYSCLKKMGLKIRLV